MTPKTRIEKLEKKIPQDDTPIVLVDWGPGNRTPENDEKIISWDDLDGEGTRIENGEDQNKG